MAEVTRARDGRKHDGCKHEQILTTFDNGRVVTWQARCTGCGKTYRALWVGRDEATDEVIGIEIG